MNKKNNRLKRSIKIRKKIQKLCVYRLTVNRSIRHIYAQILSKDNNRVLVSASTMERLISNQLKTTSNQQAAAMIGRVIAQRAIKAGIVSVSFDRSGFKYHGRVKSLAECARQYGLKF